MGIKRVVDVDFWNDEKVMDLFTPEDKLFFLYLLTNPHTTQLGIYAIHPKHISFELGYTIESVNVLLDRFENKYGNIKYSDETKEIAVKNFLKHSIIKGGAPVRDCLVKELKKVKNKELINFVFSNIKQQENVNETVKDLIADYEESNGEILYCAEKRKSNKKKKLNENENENENEVSYPVSSNDTSNDTSKPYKEIIDYLNDKAGKKFKATIADTQKRINARLAEGFTIDDFKAVIDQKCAKWKGTDMEEYLRPATLFGTKFEGYLNDIPTGKKENNSGNSMKNDIYNEYGLRKNPGF